MAGGLGTRMAEFTAGPQGRPKSMVYLLDKPLLAYQIEQLKQGGVNQAIIDEYYRPESIKKYFGDGRKFGIKIQHHLSEGLLGSAGQLKRALLDLSSDEEGFVVVIYGDIFSNVDIKKLIDFHRETPRLDNMPRITPVVIPQKYHFGVFEADEEGRARRAIGFVEKPRLLGNAAIFVLDRDLAERLPEQGDLSRDFLTPAVKEGNVSVKLYVHEGMMVNVNSLELLDPIEDWLLKERERSFGIRYPVYPEVELFYRGSNAIERK